PFRLVDQVGGYEQVIRDQFAIDGKPELGLEVPHGRAADLVFAAGLALDGECQPEGRAVPIEESIAQIERDALPRQLPAIIEIGNGANIVPDKGAADFDAEIFDRDELQLELLIDGSIFATVPGKAAGCRALEFALADIAHVGADHEPE